MSAFSSNQTDISPPEAWNYEATVAQVETIIEQIEAGKLQLAEVFEQFAAAVKYLRQCEAFLQERQLFAIANPILRSSLNRIQLYFS